MQIKEISSGKWLKVIIEAVNEKDFEKITKRRYFFNWKKEKSYSVYKLRLASNEDILGLVSFDINTAEEWILIRLLAVSIENRGLSKGFDGIAGNLISFVCREAIKLFRHNACVALEPKTNLVSYYIVNYGMVETGKRLALFGNKLQFLANKYS